MFSHPQPKTGLYAKLDNGVIDSTVFNHGIKLADSFRQSRCEKKYHLLKPLVGYHQHLK